MNKKENIIDAWILIEQLSEGSIKGKDKNLRRFDEEKKDWYNYFREFLLKQKEEHEIIDKSFEKSGLVFYFGVFDFQEIINLLRRVYEIPKTFEDISKSERFTFSLWFDNSLTLIEDKTFHTVSGYIRNVNQLPRGKEFSSFEKKFRGEISDKFEKGFNVAITKLIEEQLIKGDDFRYAFVENVESGNADMHSFFISDLEKAKKIDESDNLNRYLQGYSGDRRNLDTRKETENYSPLLFEYIMQPKFYPYGRFPSNPNHALSLMQQIAVNLSLHDKKNSIYSVNGPPGTGKTTLLKDIFADLVVQQAKEVCDISNKSIQGELIYKETYKLGFLPKGISDRNIVVASSNNGAVQNIVKELPKLERIADEFKDILKEADYFLDISNAKLSEKWTGKTKEIVYKIVGEENWGLFSLEGGKADNVSNLLLNIEAICEHFKEEFAPRESIYEEFEKLYETLDSEKERLQKYSEQVKELFILYEEYDIQKALFEKDSSTKLEEIELFCESGNNEITKLKQEEEGKSTKLAETTGKIGRVSDELSNAKRNFDIIEQQKPSLLWLVKIIKKAKATEYFDELNEMNNTINILYEEKKLLTIQESDLNKQIDTSRKKIKEIDFQVKRAKSDFNDWKMRRQKYLEGLKEKIVKLESIANQSGIKHLDLSMPYEALQKFNPWFSREFRILQSKLFSLALKVRKQFLYENRGHLKKSLIIWENPNEYISKENGERLLLESWQWLNYAIPVVSTTFASFGKMFYFLGENSISNLFIDEAGQALPQASAGAIFRSKRVMVVGDPSQIKPVLTLDSEVLNLIQREYQVDERFVSADASTQRIVDDTSQYGFIKNEEEWIGVPLWVHRRCAEPMFEISNEISYGGLMVQGKAMDYARGKGKWYNSTGVANDKYVEEQGELLKELIKERTFVNPDLVEQIYVITPFKNVAYKLAKKLDEIKFTRRNEHNNPINVGTVHTFQGKEAEIVFLVLGADNNSKGAASWAVSEPNIMNVAVTRAKSEFYVIGDRGMYASLGSKVANAVIGIIDKYNAGQV